MAAPAAISANKGLQHVRYQRRGVDGFVEPAVFSRISIELFLEGLGKRNGEPHRTLLGQPAKFQISHSSFPRQMQMRHVDRSDNPHKQ
jgi:hypothetical protein